MWRRRGQKSQSPLLQPKCRMIKGNVVNRFARYRMRGTAGSGHPHLTRKRLITEETQTFADVRAYLPFIFSSLLALTLIKSTSISNFPSLMWGWQWVSGSVSNLFRGHRGATRVPAG